MGGFGLYRLHSAVCVGSRWTGRGRSALQKYQVWPQACQQARLFYSDGALLGMLQQVRYIVTEMVSGQSIDIKSQNDRYIGSWNQCWNGSNFSVGPNVFRLSFWGNSRGKKSFRLEHMYVGPSCHITQCRVWSLPSVANLNPLKTCMTICQDHLQNECISWVCLEAGAKEIPSSLS